MQTYLVGAQNEVERVRARGQERQWVYTHTIKRFKEPGVAVEIERTVTRQQYEDLLIRTDQRLNQIHKVRYCFVYAEQYCELDVFRGSKEGVIVLEIEVPSMETNVTLPPFLSVDRDVTGDTAYSNHAMAAAG